MALKNFNWKALITVGLVAGLIQVATGVVMYLAGIYFVRWSMFVTLLVLLLCLVLGIRWYRDSVLKGPITFGQALVVGIVISVSTGIVYAVYNVISISFVYTGFLEELISLNGGNARITANTIAVANLIRLSVLGTLLSVFASLILKKKQNS